MATERFSDIETRPDIVRQPQDEHGIRLRHPGTSDDPGRSPWSFILLSLTLLMASLVLFNWETARGLWRLWWSHDSFGHGLFFIPIAIWAVWHHFAELRQARPAPAPEGLLLLALAGLTSWLGTLTDTKALTEFALAVGAVSVVLTAAGPQIARLVWLPLAYLLLSISAWSYLAVPLRELTATTSTWALHVLGIPAYRDAFFLYIPDGQFLVAEACAGLRYFTAAVAVGLVYGAVALSSVWQRLLFVCCAAVAAIVANSARVVIVVIAGHLTEMQHPWIGDHNTLGWVIFVLVLPLLYWAGAKLARVTRKETSAPVHNSDADESLGRRERSMRPTVVITAAVCLAALPALGARLASPSQPSVAALTPPTVPAVSPWVGPKEPADNWSPVFVGADAESLSVYSHGHRDILLYRAYYVSEHEGKELVYFSNAVYDGTRWLKRTARSLDIEFGTKRLRVTETEIFDTASGRRRLVWHWYNVGGQSTNSTLVAKMLRAWAVLSGRGPSFAAAIAADHSDAIVEARAPLKAFLRDHHGYLEADG